MLAPHVGHGEYGGVRLALPSKSPSVGPGPPERHTPELAANRRYAVVVHAYGFEPEVPLSLQALQDAVSAFLSTNYYHRLAPQTHAHHRPLYPVSCRGRNQQEAQGPREQRQTGKR